MVSDSYYVDTEMSFKKMCSQMGGGQPWRLPGGKLEPAINMESFYLNIDSFYFNMEPFCANMELVLLNIDSFYLNMEPFCVKTDFFY